MREFTGRRQCQVGFGRIAFREIGLHFQLKSECFRLSRGRRVEVDPELSATHSRGHRHEVPGSPFQSRRSK